MLSANVLTPVAFFGHSMGGLIVSGDHFYITSTVDEIVDDIETRIAEFGSSGS